MTDKSLQLLDRKISEGSLAEPDGLALKGIPRKQINYVHLGDNHPRDCLTFVFDDRSSIRICDNAQCCESRYMHTDDDLTYFNGATLWSVDIRDAGNVEDPENPDDNDVHEIQFLVVRTSRGEFTIETHNLHNGYYSGFDIEVEPMN